MEIELDYVSVGCNRTPQCVDWYDDHTLAYGAASSVALAEVAEDNSKAARVFATLHGHKDRVNCLTWIRLHSRAKHNGSPVGELVSGSVDKTIIVWKRDVDNQYTIRQTLEGHKSSVTAVAATYSVATETVSTTVASASSDSTVVIWLHENVAGQFVQLQTISFGRGFIMALDFHLLPECEVPLLVCGGDDSKLHLFTPSDDGKYCRVLTLSGHEDWIRSVSMTQDDSGDILIASSGQDMFVRVWRLSKEQTRDPSAADDELKVKKNSFTVSLQDQQYCFVVGLETVLLGHEDWVYSVRWQPPTDAGIQPLRLLSASMDKTMILWQPDADTGVWLEQVRVGEVGGNTLGLYGAIFSPHGNQILAHGYQGAFHLWKNVSNRDDKNIEQWEPWVIVGGHFDSVVDITWEPLNGHYLVSVSTDQTARLHAMWKRPDHQAAKSSWYEISRPQIHGYDMHCVAMVTPYLYVSGAEEKVIRVFQSPAYFLDCLATISGAKITKEVLGLPLGASVPPLGLSNKAVYTEDRVEEKPKSTTAGVKTNIFTEPELPSFEAVSLKVPPFEDHLAQNTLWPEVQKLYGHGFEVFCIAANCDGSLVASASKAAKQEHASIRIWDVSSWSQRAVLTHHTLTVTQLRFSHNGVMLLAVSRDRCWSLWKRNNDDDKELFSLAAFLDPKSRLHNRIIWSCSWSHDDKCFATASRDKKVIVWSNSDAVPEGCTDSWRPAVKPLECSDAVTAVDFAPCCYGNNYLLAIGLDDGTILLSHFDWNKITVAIKFNQSLCHASTVKRLAWQPLCRHQPGHTTTNRLASCSSDHCVKIFTVVMK